jgi:hypothetical protein
MRESESIIDIVERAKVKTLTERHLKMNNVKVNSEKKLRKHFRINVSFYKEKTVLCLSDMMQLCSGDPFWFL